MDVYNTLLSLHDAHTYCFTPLTTGFVYYHKYPLISVSETPDTQPKIYLADRTTGGPIIGAEVSRISGRSASDYMVDLAAKAMNPPIYWSDPDTRYNQLFVPQAIPELRNSQLENLGAFAARDVYPADTPQLTLTNGTRIKVEWYAMFNWWYEQRLAQPPMALPFWDQASFENLGEFGTITGPPNKKPTDSLKGKHIDGLSPYSPGPAAIKSLPDDTASYYVVDNSIGVFMLPTFSAYSRGDDQSSPGNDFVKDVCSLIDEALQYFREKNIKKVVIDVTHNGGGDIVAGFAIFLRFFPKVTSPGIYQNYRWSPQLAAITNLASADEPSLDTADVVTFSYHYETPTTGGEFSNVNDYLGPYSSTNDGFFTKMSNRNMQENIKAYDYGGLPPATQHFTADQLALLSDATCASICSTFFELMADQGVRSVAYGGRPGRSTLQFSGGIKGRQAYSYYEWLQTSSAIPNTKENRKWLPNPPPYNMGLSINLVNGFADRQDRWPREMVYEPASKSVFLTGKMATKPSERWRVAAREIWG